MLDRPPEQIADGRNRVGVEGVGHGQHDGFAALGDGNDPVALEKLQLQPVGQQRHFRQVLRVDQRQAEELGQELRQLGLGDEPQPGQHQVEALPRLALGTLRPVQRQFVQYAARRQERREPLDELVAARVGGRRAVPWSLARSSGPANDNDIRGKRLKL